MENKQRYIHQLFEEKAESLPEYTALVGDGFTITYAELNCRANQLAHYLHKLGLTNGAVVGLNLNYSLEWVTGLLGVLKAGGSFVLLDPAHPQAWRERILQEAGVQFLLMMERGATPALALPYKTLFLDQEALAIARQSQENGAAPPADQVALFSTANRLLPLKHRQISSRLQWLQKRFALTEADTLLNLSSPTEERTLSDLFWSLVSGGRFLLVQPGSSTVRIQQFLMEQHVSILHIPAPSLPLFSSLSLPPGLRLTLVSGEPPRAAQARTFTQAFAGTFSYLSGVPETGYYLESTVADLSADREYPCQGQPTHMAIYVQDARQQLVPPGGSGEIFIAGAGVEQGYIGHPAEFTQQPFLKDPRSQARMFRTGLRGRYRRDGKVELLHNLARRVWLGGEQVALAEVEHALLRQPTMHHCRALARPGQDGCLELVAYIVTSGHSSPEIWQEHLRALLPEAWIPRAYIPVSNLPLTQSGEVDDQNLLTMAAVTLNTMAWWEEHLKTLEGVEHVAVIAQEYHDTRLPLHLNDVLPGWSSAIDATQSVMTMPVAPPPVALDGQLSISEGGALHPLFPAIRTLPQALLHTAGQDSDACLLCVLQDGSELTWTYQQFLEEARRIQAGLQRWGLGPGDPVIMQVEWCQEFLPLLWGCFLGGMVPVPVAVAPTYEQMTSASERLLHAWRMLGHPPVVAGSNLSPSLSALATREGWDEHFRVLSLDALRSATAVDLPCYEGQPEDLALILLTSGSTGAAKGVPLSHRNLLSMVQGMIQSMQRVPRGDVTFNWMPLDHVGGIVMLHLSALYLGNTQIHTLPQTILQDPLRWLDAIERYRANITWAPNFAFGLVNEQAGEIQKRHWDLSSMYYLFNGGEAIAAKTARTFLQLLQPQGLPANAIRPAWGMSETSSGVIFSHLFLRETTSDSDQFVEVGEPIPGLDLRVVDEHQKVVKEGNVGSLQVRGLSVTGGYYQNERATREAFTPDSWFETGDLAVMRAGRVTITGRAKDTIIINGINYYSQEIEAAVDELEEVETSYTAACAVRDQQSITDQLALFIVSRVEESHFLDMLKKVQARVRARVGLTPTYVLPVQKEDIPKTTIGKIQRTQLKQEFEAGKYRPLLKQLDCLLGNANTLPDWFYRKCWQRRATEQEWLPGVTGAVLVLTDEDDPLGLILCQHLLERGLVCIQVRRGAHFVRLQEGLYQVNPGREDGYRSLLLDLAEQQITVERIVHLWIASERLETFAESAAEQFTAASDVGWVSLLLLAQALEYRRNWDDAKDRRYNLLVVSNQIQAVRATEEIAYSHAPLSGLLKTLTQEIPWLHCIHVDIAGSDARQNALNVLTDLLTNEEDREVAYRDGQRYVARLERIEWVKEPEQPLPLRRGGYYLISGGLGELGYELAKRLLQEYHAHLLLIGRSALETTADTAGTRSARLRDLQELGRQGGSVSYAEVDVCDLARLQDIVVQTSQQWVHTLDGVFHLAGTFYEQPLLQEQPECIRQALRSKVEGAWNLHQLLKDSPDALFVSFSSVNAFFGGRGVGAYAAANCFLESFAHYQRVHCGLRSYCIAWSMWDNLGMSRDYQLKGFSQAHGYHVITAQRGWYSLLLLLHRMPANVLVGLEGWNQHIRPTLTSSSHALQEAVAYLSPGLCGGDQRIWPDEHGNLPGNYRLVPLTSLPLDSAGEVDRKRLAALGSTLEQELAQQPRSELERQLLEIWRQVLGNPRAGVLENFFELGGHSLLATQLVARLQSSLQINVPVRSLFDHPTVEQMARFIERQKLPAQSVPALVSTARMSPLPLSFAQQRLWFLDQLEPGSTTYTIPVAVRLRGELDRLALAQALAEVIQRHESLRTIFPSRQGVPVQQILPSIPTPLRLLDLSHVSEEEREGEARRLAQQEVEQPFDLARGPLLRGWLLRLERQDHALLLTMHHIISDGWSVNILLGELTALYTAFVRGERASLPPLPVQYADYALWQRSWLQGEVLQQHLDYWKQQLAGIVPLEFPTDYPRPPIQTFRGAREHVLLPATLSQQLQELSASEGVTLFMTLLAAFQVLLARYSGQQDIVVGTPIANRTHQETEGLIGFFANNLVLRTDLSGHPSFVQVLGRVRGVALQAYAHQDAPFEQVVEVLHPQRDQSRSPLFQVLFILQNMPGVLETDTSLRIERFAFEQLTAKFDMNISITENAQGLGVTLEYNTDLFTKSTIQRLLTHWQTLLGSLLAHPELPVSRLALLTPAECHHLLVTRNPVPFEEIPRPSLTHRLVRQVTARPDALALSFQEQQFTYACLGQRASTLVQQLRARGIGAEMVVGLCLERSPDLLIALLAVLQSGAAYLPLDPALPAERLGFQLADAQVRLVLSRQQEAQALPASEVEILWLDSSETWQPLASEHEPLPEPVPQQVAYVIYTSGSTGRPKGVQISQQALLSFLEAIRPYLGMQAGERWLAVTTISFDIAALELLLPLLVGGHVVLASASSATDASCLLRLLEQIQPEFMQATPATWQMLLAENWYGQLGMQVLCGGEALSAELGQALVERAGRVWNVYGPTEATIWSMIALVRQGEPITLGEPLANTQVYVLDAQGEPVPQGVVGEVSLGGMGLARGYVGRAELTAERFVPHPFSEKGGERLYRTGDLARVRADGMLEYRGRNDAQIKLRGFRIELGEIEAVLGQHPQVKQCVVVLQGTTIQEKRLVACIVRRDGATNLAGGPEDLRFYLKGKLPAYMVPARFVLLNSLPLTSNGKVDRRALADLNWEELEAQQSEPDKAGMLLTSLEELIMQCWKQTLQVEHASMQDNFFERGGHSLLATQLVARLREAAGVDVPLRVVFEAPILAELVQQIEHIMRREAGLEECSLFLVERPHELPLSFAQQRLWFLDRLAPGGTAYLAASALRVSGMLDVCALEKALQALISRHESLRTTFVERAGQPVQIIHPAWNVLLPVIDLQGLNQADREKQARLLATQEAQCPCDLTRGPLLRCSLMRVEEQEHVLLLTLHHIITDGWSNQIVMRDLTTLYQAMVAGQLSPLAPLSVQYADYAIWQRRWLQGEVLATQLAYWKTYLAEITPLALPTDHPRPAVQSQRGALLERPLPLALSMELHALSQQEHVTLFMLLLAAFQVLLARYTGLHDISVGTPIANRRYKEVEDVIGFFVNTLVMRTNLVGDPTFQQVLQQVREICLRAYTHQDIPFEKVVEELEPERDMSRSPLFQVMFVLQNMPRAQEKLSDIQIQPFAVDELTSKFDLTLFLQETAQGLRCAVEYNTDLFEARTIERLLTQWQTLLEGILRAPQIRVSEVPLLSAQEQDLLLTHWNATRQDFPQARCIHHLFEEQVERTPDAVALVIEDYALTYTGLNQCANQLAHHLQAQGVGPEVPVGICMQRSLEMVVGVLGVLKAGGAYVPLDPTYPAERLRYIIRDQRLALVLTETQTRQDVIVAECRQLALDPFMLSGDPCHQANLGLSMTPDNLFYVIYTSGSTGKPKGVGVSHRSFGNLLAAFQQDFQYQTWDRTLLVTSFNFDLTQKNFFAPLLTGGCLQLLPGSYNAALICHLLAERAITLLNCTPGMFYPVIEESAYHHFVALFSLRYVFLGGETIALPRLQSWMASPQCQATLVNTYGPTECSDVVATLSLVNLRSETMSTVPIGRPIANTQIYLLDRWGNPVPVGVTGELHVGGNGVTRGYLNFPEQTAERFIPHPWSQDPGARLYRTGDLARFLPNGTIEYLGRIDQQVKIRGHRIELGEIEVALVNHPAIEDAAVIVRENQPGDTHLAAYVVLDRLHTEEASAEVQSHLIAERVQSWQQMYDETYRQSDPQGDETFTLAGWNSSYTGQPIAAEEMRNWLEDTLALVRGFHPQHLLEIGCGTGMLLFALAPNCTSYYGTDFSAPVLASVRRQLAQLQKTDQKWAAVTLLHQPADDVRGLPAKQIDTILINSVIQYFPDITYLLQVLENALRLVVPGGRIIIGDIRNFLLLEAFHADVQLHRAPDNLTRSRLRYLVQQRLQQEEELTVSPEFFRRWAQTTERISRVEIRLKRGRYHNELTQFRYQAVLHIGEPVARAKMPRQACCEEELNWSEQGLTLELLHQKIRDEQPSRLRLRHVPNARLGQAIQALQWLWGEDGPETVEYWRAALKTQAGYGVEPEDLWELGEQAGYQVRLSWSERATDGNYSALLWRENRDEEEELFLQETADPAPVDWREYANQPLQREVESLMVPQIQQYLRERLPEYMLPAHLAILNALPLTTNGKVDRHMLQAQEEKQDREQRDLEKIVTPLEELLEDLWCEILGQTRVGRHCNFFEFGGHSLAATRLVARIRATIGVEIPLRVVFEAPTLAELARRVEQNMRESAGMVEQPLQLMERPQELPLSFAQQRLWFLDQLEPGSTTYTIPVAVRLRSELDRSALAQALAEVIQRHESLRTIFPSRQGVPVQQILPSIPTPLRLLDLSHVSEEEREGEARRLAQQEVEQPFDLARGPLLRGWLLRLERQDHALLLTMHHIISDGWSMSILVNELTALYTAFVRGERASLPPLPVQYADYALWQRSWLQGEVLQQQLDYWKRQLEGITPLQLPTDHPHPPIQRFRGARQHLLLPAELGQQMQALAHQERVTLFMALLAAFQVLLARYSGQQDIVVGTPIANRTHQETEGLIGFFANNLVLRTDLSGHPSFVQVLGRVRGVALQAYAHQDAPFEQVVEVLHPQRDQSRSPLFQVGFSMQTASEIPVRQTALYIEELTFEQHTTKFDLRMGVTLREQGLSTTLEYNMDLFEASTIQWLLQHWQVLLEGIVTHPQQQIALLPLLTAEERARVLLEWNPAQSQASEKACLHQLFEAQAQRTPQAVALVSEECHLSYAYLNQRANQLARFLCSRRVGPDSLVALSLTRSVDMLVGLLGILKAGGAYMPLDPGYPMDRLQFMLQDAQVSLVVTLDQFRTQIPTDGIPVLCLDTDWSQLASQPGENLPALGCADHLAYVIYTSGSTGKPKGVLIEHQSVCAILLDSIRACEIERGERIMQCASLSFDASILEIFLTLLTGSTLCLLPARTLASGVELSNLLHREAITSLIMTPPQLETLPIEGLPDVHKLIIGGETCPVPTVERCAAGRHFFTVYGPTETAIQALVQKRTEHYLDGAPIGRPLDTVQVYLLDTHGQPVPIGVPGEICIGGAGLARGYLRAPDMTAGRFIPHPFSQVPGQRLYRTGDLARYRADGTVEFLGRLDAQVKLRGYRIELGEIEAALNQSSWITQSIVLLQGETALERQLIAYVVVAEDQNIPLEPQVELRRLLKSTLPDYMVPAHFVLLDSLPLTANGKVDHRRLSALSWKQAEQEPQDEAGSSLTPLEAVVLQCWREILQTDDLGVEDNFFEQGGHSLLATQMVAHLQQLTGVQVPLVAIFEAPTVAGVAMWIAQELQQEQPAPSAIVPVPRNQSLPLSFAQQRLWFLHQLDPQSIAYNVPTVVYLRGHLDRSAFERALNRVIQRHESLRTVFPSQQGVPVQHIVPTSMTRMQFIDLNHLREEEGEQEARRLARQATEQPFDLACGPLLRCWLVALSEQDHMLALTMHHIVSDGWSMSILVNELSSLYTAFVRREPASLPALPVQYADYALWQRNWLQGEALQQQLNYWKRQLEGATPLQLPTDYPRQATRTFPGANRSFRFPASLSPYLKNLEQQEGVTLFMILLASLNVLLHYATGQNDLVIGTDVASRNRAETEGLIGFFVNQLVLRTDLSGNPTFHEILRREKKVTLDAYEHQDLPFDRLLAEVNPDRDLSSTPLFQIKFLLQNTPELEATLPRLRVEAVKQERDFAKFDLLFVMSERGNELFGVLDYRTDIFSEKTITRFLHLFGAVLEQATTFPDTTLHEIETFLAQKDAEERIRQENELQQRNMQNLKQSRRKTIQSIQ